MSGNLAGACSPCSWPKARGQGKQEIKAGWTSGHRVWVRGSVQLEELEWLLGECVSEMHKAFLSSAFGTKQGFPKPRDAWATGASLVE